MLDQVDYFVWEMSESSIIQIKSLSSSDGPAWLRNIVVCDMVLCRLVQGPFRVLDQVVRVWCAPVRPR